MDPLVLQAMAKWPHVPDCYGWLGLDARGRWWLRDAQAQAAGAFPQSLGNRLEHVQFQAFIGRNYAVDARGCWFFQNGPQRVFVELANTPVLWRTQADGTVLAHPQGQAQGQGSAVQACVLDEAGLLYVWDGQVLGLLHSQDMLDAAQWLEQGRWPAPEDVAWAELPQRFGFVRSPQALMAA